MLLPVKNLSFITDIIEHAFFGRHSFDIAIRKFEFTVRAHNLYKSKIEKKIGNSTMEIHRWKLSATTTLG